MYILKGYHSKSRLHQEIRWKQIVWRNYLFSFLAFLVTTILKPDSDFGSSLEYNFMLKCTGSFEKYTVTETIPTIVIMAMQNTTSIRILSIIFLFTSLIFVFCCGIPYTWGRNTICYDKYSKIEKYKSKMEYFNYIILLNGNKRKNQKCRYYIKKIILLKFQKYNFFNVINVDKRD